jgi:hypothetical protein
MNEVRIVSATTTALLRGGQDAAASGRLDGVVLAGWPTGARVHAEFERHIPLTRPISRARTPP